MAIMSELPAPLVPPEVDLTGFEWMALLGHRMFKSAWYRAARKDGRGGLASVKLWWEASFQHPAGSLPNDEEELCMLADFGEDMKAWRKHRIVAMHGFILCSDNRWYHPVVSEQALKAYNCKLRASQTRQVDAERLRKWRASRNGSHPPEKPNGQAPPETPNETRFTTRFETHLETPSETCVETSRARCTEGTKRDLETGEEKEESLKTLTLPLPTRDRAREQQPAEDEKPARTDRTNDEPITDDPLVRAHIQRAADAIKMRVPYGEVRTWEEQAEAVLASQPSQPPVDEAMGMAWQPAPAVRTLEQQIAAATAGASPEQIERARVAFAMRAGGYAALPMAAAQ
jgi:O6-methylguanine-DNA--protein-cysteine methyltransferase